jgi:hypothetical protein
MRRAAIILALGAGPAQAFPCVFDIECYENDACATADFNIDVGIDAKSISTEFGDIAIVAVRETGRLTTLFATGQGAEYMLSITPVAARLTTHSNDGPQVISYLGTCEGAF